MPELTNKQRVFVQEYIIDFNGAAAAVRAGYSEHSAKQIAKENLTKPYLKAAIEKALEERSQRTLITADWVLTRLVEEATADIADLHTEDGALKPVDQWPLVWRQGLVAGLDVEEEWEDGEKVGRTSKVKLSDRTRRLEMIGKHVGVQAFRDRHEIGTNVNIVISSEDAGLL